MNIMNKWLFIITTGILITIGCSKDEVTYPPDIKDKRGLFDASFENDYNYIYYKGDARYSQYVDSDGQQHFVLKLQDNKVPRNSISSDIEFNLDSPGIQVGTYYYNSLTAAVDSPSVAINLSYGNYDFDEHKDLNFGIIYLSLVKIQSIKDGVVKGYIDAHLKCNSCPVLPYLMTARFEAVEE
jgi:hypothetical protein